MLSRIADSLFWIGRYIERAEQLARDGRVRLLRPRAQQRRDIHASKLRPCGAHCWAP